MESSEGVRRYPIKPDFFATQGEASPPARVFASVTPCAGLNSFRTVTNTRLSETGGESLRSCDLSHGSDFCRPIPTNHPATNHRRKRRANLLASRCLRRLAGSLKSAVEIECEIDVVHHSGRGARQ